MELTVKEVEKLINAKKYELRDLCLNYIDNCGYDCKDFWKQTTDLADNLLSILHRINDYKNYIKGIERNDK